MHVKQSFVDNTSLLSAPLIYLSFTLPYLTVPSSYKITRVAEFLKGHEVLFDCSRTDEPIKYADTSSLIVGTACPCPTKWLLANHGACGFFVVINISSGVTQFVSSLNQSWTRRGKATYDIRRGGFDRMKNLTQNQSERSRMSYQRTRAFSRSHYPRKHKPLLLINLSNL